jgi:hypothetical protein
VRILFCGDCFPASQSLLKERLPIGEDEVVVCNGINLRKALANCDVVIPMMTILDDALIEAGGFRLVQQWGSGLEGMDLDAARARGIWVANVPASGNSADSVAEHALLLTLALLRHLPAAQANVRTSALGAPLGRMWQAAPCVSTVSAPRRVRWPIGFVPWECGLSELRGIQLLQRLPNSRSTNASVQVSVTKLCRERTCSYFVSVSRTRRAGWLTPVRSRRCLPARFLSMPRAADSFTIARFMMRSRAAISAAPDSMSIGRNHFLRMTRC